MSDDVRYNWADLIADKPAPQPQAARPVANGHSGNGYAAAALSREVENVATASVGSRNDTLNRAAFNLAQLVASGHLEAAVVHHHLTAAALLAGLGAGEIDATLRSGHRAGSHAYGCAWATRGAVCDCPAFKAWLRDWAAAIADDTRGIDYSRYTAAEGINEGDDE